MNRRDAIKTATVSSAVLFTNPGTQVDSIKANGKFKLSLNTSTISGQKPGVEKYIEIAARAGYECIELWIPDIREYVAGGGTLQKIKRKLDDAKVKMVNAIGFAPWMVDDAAQRKQGFAQMKEEMEMIAAPSFGVTEQLPDLFAVGERFQELIALGKTTGVTPLLEFWGASKFFHIGQAMMAVCVANQPDVKILADVYHLHRGNSGFESLKMIDGRLIEVFHMNDYPGNIAREQLEDKDRIYPGDGVAPLKQILSDLKNMGGEKILSLELFNREYWKQDPLLVARTGIEKMKKLIAEIS